MEIIGAKLDANAFHRPACSDPLKPPVFQCEAGHRACRSFHGKLPGEQCHSCNYSGGGPAASCIGLDDFVYSPKVRCPYTQYGCGSSVAYHEFGNHKRSWPISPPCTLGRPVYKIQYAEDVGLQRDGGGAAVPARPRGGRSSARSS